MKNKAKMIVSACLAGSSCRYDGKANLVPEIRKLVERGEALPLCPECLGGLEIPRKPCEIRVVKGIKKVYNIQNEEVTAEFEKGALKALFVAKEAGILFAILKAKSPSCGCDKVYDGRFNKTLVEGEGITAALFKQNGIVVINEEQWLRKNQEELWKTK